MPSQAQDAVRAQVTKEFDAGAASQMPEIQQLDLSDGKGKALGGRELEIQDSETKSGGSRKAQKSGHGNDSKFEIEIRNGDKRTTANPGHQHKVNTHRNKFSRHDGFSRTHSLHDALREVQEHGFSPWRRRVQGCS